jgi:uncharacterized C2H2 Zn-finger protein
MRYKDEQNENDEGSEQMECPHCGRMFMCGGTVKKAEGGEIEPSRWKKREAKLPDLELDVYRGEGVPRGDPDLGPGVVTDEERKRLAYARELRRRRGY